MPEGAPEGPTLVSNNRMGGPPPGGPPPGGPPPGGPPRNGPPPGNRKPAPPKDRARQGPDNAIETTVRTFATICFTISWFFTRFIN